MPIDHTTKHPGAHHFEGIRGKKPAHPDHDSGKYKTSKYMEGGHDGYSHNDGIAGAGNSESAEGSSIATPGESLTIPPPASLPK